MHITGSQRGAAVKQYRLPKSIRDAYRDRDLILPRARPYSEITRDLDAIAAMSEAADPEVQELLARDRLLLLDEKGHEREGAWDQDFGLAVGHSAVGSESEPLASEELTRGIRYAYRLQQLGFPYEEVLAAWDGLTGKPLDTGFANWIIHNRLMVTLEYQRPAEDMDREIQRAMTVFAGQPIKDWAHTISSACSTHPTLAEKYLPPLIAELEQELGEQPDLDDQQMIDWIRDDLERARSMAAPGPPEE